MHGADLSEADLSKAQFSGSDLGNLIYVTTSVGNYSSRSYRVCKAANLSNVNLSEANLENAHLNNADLSWADLEQADCKRSRMDSALLQYASLKGTKNLTQEQIDSAEGNSKTILPNGLQRPAHWEE